MYIDIWGSLYQVCLLVRARKWVFWDPLFFVFILSHLFSKWEMSDLLLRVLGHCPFHHYIDCWCDFYSIFWSEFIIIPFYVFIISSSSSLLFSIHLLRFTPCSFPTMTYFSLHHPYTSLYQFNLLHCLIIDIIFTLGTLRSTTHEIFYTCCILYMRVWVLIIGYLSLVFLHIFTLLP